jgi:hypothetical protein
MSASGNPSAAELAAQQVESIVKAAEQAAEQLKHEIRAELQEERARALREGDEIRAEARRDAQRELDTARKQALALGQDARAEAKGLLEQAESDSAQIREQTRRAVEGRVIAAEKAAAEVLEEAHALSGGLRRLAGVLGDQAERILRDVQAAHKRMQADLRVAPELQPPRSPRTPGLGERERSELSERERIIKAAEEARSAERAAPTPPRRPAGEPARRNPFDDLEVPSWVGRER